MGFGLRNRKDRPYIRRFYWESDGRTFPSTEDGWGFFGDTSYRSFEGGYLKLISTDSGGTRNSIAYFQNSNICL